MSKSVPEQRSKPCRLPSTAVGAWTSRVGLLLQRREKKRQCQVGVEKDQGCLGEEAPVGGPIRAGVVSTASLSGLHTSVLGHVRPDSPVLAHGSGRQGVHQGKDFPCSKVTNVAMLIAANQQVAQGCETDIKQTNSTSQEILPPHFQHCGEILG